MKMNKIIIAAFAALVVPALCSAIVIGDFEGALDGWTPGYSNAYSSVGVTLGAQSLLLNNAGGGWSAMMEKSIFGDTTVMGLLSSGSGQVTMDITATGGTGVPDFWLQAEIFVNTDGHWSTMGYNEIDLGGSPNTYTFDLSPAAAAALANPSATYASIGLVANGGGSGYEINVDNIQAIPEPATLGLLGIFGGAMLVLRRNFRT